MALEILSKSEAQKRAEQMRVVSDEVIGEVNALITGHYAIGNKVVQFARPANISNPAWQALATLLQNKGYSVKACSESRDGEWLNITL